MTSLETSIAILTIQTGWGSGWPTPGYGSIRGQDHYDVRGSRDYDRGYDSRIGSGRRAFGGVYRRDDDYRGGGDCYEDRYNRQDDQPWGSRDDYPWDDYGHDDSGPPKGPNYLKLQSTPKEDDSSASTSQSSQAAPIFGGAKPGDTAAREREGEERLQKEQEKLQCHLDEPKLERRPPERHPTWRSEEP
ncbi:Eukaryotic translation initiation factor 4B [Fukomys damarensis]|uniref:Eukaryotic translation initiation factor 4B n=1 Tax=Fukomys damarensis TaxID=885580 RepID=A0A091DB11_FUKDA|nr:Eukaryotic translation initiation factor 4B [Fukomys damarensis]